jgi:hypothetical protein
VEIVSKSFTVGKKGRTFVTRDQAQLIMKHLDIVEHFANGGGLEFYQTDYTGKFLGWSTVIKGLHINCLPRYRKGVLLGPDMATMCPSGLKCPFLRDNVEFENNSHQHAKYKIKIGFSDNRKNAYGGTMQAYIGCKIILAEECCKEAFEAAKNSEFEGGFDFDTKIETPINPTPGYHVVYSNPDGSKYHSWSPKEQFDRSYRRIETDEKVLISSY